MTKQELMENYTMEQLADMIINLQGQMKTLRTRCHGENTFKNFDNHSWGLLHIVGREDIKCGELNVDSQTLADFLPAEPIKVADVLINLFFEPRSVDEDGNELVFHKRKFEMSELRQIAEHLLVYCNANGGISNE